MVSGAFAQEVFVEGLKRKNAIYASRLKRKFDVSLFRMCRLAFASIENFMNVSTM
jgi:hypothetical protein